MHRDIKGGNLLIDNGGRVKLADFGASKKIESLATIGTLEPCKASSQYDELWLPGFAIRVDSSDGFVT